MNNTSQGGATEGNTTDDALMVHQGSRFQESLERRKKENAIGVEICQGGVI
jgi:hypothetical protein